MPPLPPTQPPLPPNPPGYDMAAGVVLGGALNGNGTGGLIPATAAAYSNGSSPSMLHANGVGVQQAAVAAAHNAGMMPPLPPLPPGHSIGPGLSPSASYHHNLGGVDPLGALLATEQQKPSTGCWEGGWGETCASAAKTSSVYNGALGNGNGANGGVPNFGMPGDSDGFEDSFEDAALMRDLASLLRDEPDTLVPGGPPGRLGGLYNGF